ncbi:MAG: hypothetical protein AAF889_10260 [Cyanobacteria bacterium P01_D01_bin.73]
MSKAPKAAPKPEIATPAAQNTTLPATNTGLAFPLAEGEDPNKPSPIPPPSETLQYRAIGLVRGRYVPDVDQFTKGHMVTSDGTTVNTVLLGRVMSLLKKHVDLNVDHLWVVYPRTRAENLHMQIVGIWEPETLSKNAEDEETTPEGEAAEGTSAVEEPADAETNASAEASDDGEAEATATSDGDDAGESSDDSSESEGPKVIRLAKPARPAAPSKPAEPAPKPGKARPKAIPYHVPEDGFSIRGEVVLQSKDEHFVMVQIKQLPRPPKHKGKAFKLRLEGMLGDRAVGHFWDIQVMRKEDKLTILSGTPMGALPPQKRKKPSFGGRGGGRRPSGGHPSGRGDRSGAPRSEPRNVPRPAKPRPKVQE